MTDETKTLKDIREEIDGINIAMLTTLDAAGEQLSARPLALQDIDDDGHVLFLVDKAAEWVTPGSTRANVAITGDDVWVSIAGTLTYTDDAGLIDRLWGPTTDAWFANGKSDATVAHLAADTWEYWTAPNKLAQAFRIGKALATDESTDFGDRGSIDV